MDLQLPILPFANPQLAVAWLPFVGEGSETEIADFSGRALWLSGSWNAWLVNGVVQKISGFAGDWPFVELLPVVALAPEGDASGYEISSELILKHIYASLNSMEHYILIMMRTGLPVTTDGVNLGNGILQRWSLYLGQLKQDVVSTLISAMLEWISGHQESGFIVFEILRDSKEISVFEGKTDAKGEVIQNIGSIFEHEKEVSLSGLPLQWHMRKIPGWPLALEQGVPVICARMESDDSYRVLLLLARLYGRRFRNILFLFNHEETYQLWKTRMHHNLPVTGTKGAKGSSPEILWPTVSDKEIHILPDFLWNQDRFWDTGAQVKQGRGYALFGWSFCYFILDAMGLRKKIWDSLFPNLNIFSKLPITFPVKEVIDSKKWVKFWHGIVGDATLESLGVGVWTFSNEMHQWHTFGPLSELLAEHSLLPIEYENSKLSQFLLIYPQLWKRVEIKNFFFDQSRLASWPIWDAKVAKYLQKLREVWFF